MHSDKVEHSLLFSNNTLEIMPQRCCSTLSPLARGICWQERATNRSRFPTTILQGSIENHVNDSCASEIVNNDEKEKKEKVIRVMNTARFQAGPDRNEERLTSIFLCAISYCHVHQRLYSNVIRPTIITIYSH